MAAEQFEQLKNLQNQLKITIKKDDVKINKFKILSLKKGVSKVKENSAKKVNILSNVIVNTVKSTLTSGKEAPILYKMLNPAECINEQPSMPETSDFVMIDIGPYPSGSECANLEPTEIYLGTDTINSIIEQPRRRIGGKNIDMLQHILDDLGQIGSHVPTEVDETEQPAEVDETAQTAEVEELAQLDIDAPKSLVGNMLESISKMREQFADEQASVARTVDFLEHNLRSWRERLTALNRELEYLDKAFSNISQVV